MAHQTMVGGTKYAITGGRTLVGGTNYEITGGKTMVGGTVFAVPFGASLVTLTVSASSNTGGMGVSSTITVGDLTIGDSTSGTYEIEVGSKITIKATGNATHNFYMNGTKVKSGIGTQTYSFVATSNVSITREFSWGSPFGYNIRITTS